MLPQYGRFYFIYYTNTDKVVRVEIRYCDDVNSFNMSKDKVFRGPHFVMLYNEAFPDLPWSSAYVEQVKDDIFTFWLS